MSGWEISLLEDAVLVTMRTNSVNAQNPLFFADLHKTFDLLENQYQNLPVILTAEGSTFSAGIDFDYSFKLFAEGDVEAVQAWFENYRETNLRLFRFPQPLIAAMNGHAYAGGLITALCCDFRFVVPEARLALNEVPVGVPMPSCYTEIIRSQIPEPTLSELILFGRVYEGSEAVQAGIAHRVVNHGELVHEAVEFASRIESDTFPAYRISKKAIRQPVQNAIAKWSAKLDQNVCEALVQADCRSAQQRAYQQLKGVGL